MLSDEQKKMLTEEILGECWHRPDYGSQMINPKFYVGVPCACGKVSYNVKHEKKSNRTFTSWQDLGDLKEKIVEMWEWRTFYRWAYDYAGSNLLNKGYTYEDDFCNWLMNPERFCELVAKWWKERRKG